ncbi:MAG: RluA family pseudouridine synthase [Clostridia bacterium]|nr:RluA family pseudouridine synthase [Clostridia bacterium]
MRVLEFVIDDEYSNRKLYSFLRRNVQLSLRLVRRLKTLPEGILCNGVPIRTVDIVKKGDVITLNLPEDNVNITPCELMPDVVYEDSDLLIVNKPPMLPIHESHNHQGDTLQNSVSAYLMKKGINCAFRAIGRLDKGTSGLVVCALNSHTASRLSGNIEKEYLAVATGIYEGEGTIDAPIYRPDPMKTYRTVDERGDRAVTHWKAVERIGNCTLLKIRLETGRTHQIRVHFAHLGTALFGDTMYGCVSEKLCHQALHCHKVSLVHPVTQKEIVCVTEPPWNKEIFE